MKLYVGNLPYHTNETALETLFSEHGKVNDVRIIYDRYSNQSKGFGFVEMENEEEALAAIDKLNDHSLEGRNIKVNEARERSQNQGGGGGGGGGGRNRY